jgi:hypothetical protein
MTARGVRNVSLGCGMQLATSSGPQGRNMALFRTRQSVRLLPGPRLSLSQGDPRTPAVMPVMRATFDRRARRAEPGLPAMVQNLTYENPRNMNTPDKRQPPVVSLLVAGVLVLWLVLSLMGLH